MSIRETNFAGIRAIGLTGEASDLPRLRDLSKNDEPLGSGSGRRSSAALPQASFAAGNLSEQINRPELRREGKGQTGRQSSGIKSKLQPRRGSAKEGFRSSECGYNPREVVRAATVDNSDVLVTRSLRLIICSDDFGAQLVERRAERLTRLQALLHRAAETFVDQCDVNIALVQVDDFVDGTPGRHRTFMIAGIEFAIPAVSQYNGSFPTPAIT